MKRVVSFLLVVLVVMSFATVAFAAELWEITEWSGFRNQKRYSYHNTSTKVIQDIISCCGIPLTIDGAYGTGTEQGVRTYQGSVGLPVVGEVGPDTWSDLCDELYCSKTENYGTVQVKTYSLRSNHALEELYGEMQRSMGSGFRYWTYKAPGSSSFLQFGIY